jgi:hypothetical protein
MSDLPFDRDEERLRVAVRDGLVARDRAMRSPRFACSWPTMAASQRPGASLRPAFATLAAVAVLAGISWLFLERHAGDPKPPADVGAAVELARELSSPDFWRVPTDDLLAFAAPPLSADLPSAEGFHVSLEESLL